MMNVESETLVVNLRTLASWYYPELQREDDVMVSIPRLQRGLVWRAQQVEFLWDSILRGYPIGSFVVSNAIAKQNAPEANNVPLHLLDGQQRSNAIALGFHCPQFKQGNESEDSSILWLDLAPRETLSKGTRSFVLRLTKIAHPWGYKLDENCSRLSAGEIRASLEGFDCGESRFAKRPKPVELRPYKAEFPVPLSLLLTAAEAETIEEGVARLLGSLSEIDQKWARSVEELLHTEFVVTKFPRIWRALKRALSAKLVLLKAPEELVHTDNEESLTHIELLFQRLNTQGTPLGGEELSYSMLKAYFPEVVETVDAVQNLRMPASRLVHLAIRAALTKEEDGKLHSGVDLNRLRSIMKKRDKNDPEYCGIQKYCTDLNVLPRYCAKIDEWLCYSEGSDKLPKYIVSNIASGSREIYLLFLVWAAKDDDRPMSKEVVDCFPGLATSLRWFGDKVGHCCNLIYQHTQSEVSVENIRQALLAAMDQEYLGALHAPEDVRKFVAPLSEGQLGAAQLQEWRWWDTLIVQSEEREQYALREKLWHGFLNRVKGQKELLLYCQRHYLWEHFHHYDQSNTEYWEGHNRPWDYDHILARNCVVGKHSDSAPFKKVAREWVDTIGNFWACSFEENRAFGDSDASEKMTVDFLRNSFISQEEFDGFNSGHHTCRNEQSARAYCESARSRFLRIYEEWYYSAKIDKLLG